MSSKAIALMCIIFCSTETFPPDNSNIFNNIFTTYEEIREYIDKVVNNVTRVRTTTELQLKGNELATLDFIGLVQQYEGYKAEDYDVQTEDGYILKLQRISNSSVCPKASNKPVVFMQHSLAANSDVFVILGPKHDLAFLLTNACYDVCFGNARGTTYSKRHIKYSSANTNYDFWKINLDDVATKDIPTFIDAVLVKTNKTKLTYIGFALGNMLSYMLLSSKPEYNDKINLSISLSPFAYFIEPYSLWFYSDLVLKPLLNTMSLLHSDLTNGASLDEVEHITQLESKKKLIKFDFGPSVNQKKHNSSEPPVYDLSKITTPQVIFYADQDTWVNRKAAEKLKNDLKNVVAFEKVPESYLTYDFIWAKNAKIEYYYKVLNSVKKYTYIIVID